MLSNIGMPETPFDVKDVHNNMYCTDMLTFPILSVCLIFKKCVCMLIPLGVGVRWQKSAYFMPFC